MKSNLCPQRRMAKQCNFLRAERLNVEKLRHIRSIFISMLPNVNMSGAFK